MKISPERVAEIAKLARLELDEDKLSLFAGQFESILNYMETLNELDTSEVEPLYSPVMHSTVLRDDVAAKTAERDAVLSNAPQTDGQFFVVPKIV
ncbi:Asp-tRNA(Asn)/Glu-tRNA(Gln) amidotransferase subunit GatC [Desulfovibrio subterraneus]|jgi:aspartyl-tRNA(Asn)/glutamyl-tRNA(Gln) amidotransferase subunit C|uniref:Asp-tRNA(Asn)/Glu-tRNA(Gln) amidotransferase subunit GatC n=1 Tax=Desulfovibrio subterraneus TaxID=2718620 RepID=UPI0022B8B465|nr:Asp-tRNA(Asn)/Glu-tRNA(Gln) amidotransferase subunit GatC [Desulfovibrio subterraneus]WBF68900.1 Asp-tRNA(Asn)/Glu-tRNA(Gln) amidotransferase subunit GatC [Desulfovibrio subterraneus]